jgi:hypothetical protein
MWHQRVWVAKSDFCLKISDSASRASAGGLSTVRFGKPSLLSGLAESGYEEGSAWGAGKLASAVALGSNSGLFELPLAA